MNPTPKTIIEGTNIHAAIDLVPRAAQPTYIPTFRELLAEYKKIAVMERVKSERPSAITVTNAETGIRAILPEGWMDRPVFDLTRRRIDEYLVRAIQSGHSPVTAWLYVLQLRPKKSPCIRRKNMVYYQHN